ncbi:MAG: isoprenylcysteine carboxylmethyltransferase family protein [Candidatus Bathyarchaeota archaeon]|nr:isoprenylcysteine carboxylmethyltransferase family protein [Candidatus Bathyarchaeota archaeon]
MTTLDLVVTAAGGVFTLVGVAICVYWYTFWQRNFQGKLITHGPYEYVRHPFYTGFLLLALGANLVLPIFEVRLLLVFTLAGMTVIIPKEEEALIRQYKKKYRDYMAKVKYRLIPGIY